MLVEDYYYSLYSYYCIMSNPVIKKEFGKHYIVELVGCDAKKIASEKTVKKALIHAAKECGATIVDYKFKQFMPHGVSGVVLIVESHITIHTWPEDKYAAVDIFTCGKTMRPQIALSILEKEFCAKKIITKILRRGY